MSTSIQALPRLTNLKSAFVPPIHERFVKDTESTKGYTNADLRPDAAEHPTLPRLSAMATPSRKPIQNHQTSLSRHVHEDRFV